ncbi:hypothetical protein V7S57_02370 [Caulobacter sp. CCNWLY153]|uniref:hypothetical protein n=1 Tax=unclassified Caulobacter TaxID=2648921 RepID=UPI002FF1ACAD
MTLTQYPPPLTPAGSNIKDWPSMLVDVARLRDSGIASHEDPEVFRTSFMLWCASWHQTPVASLKDDDAELAKLAGFGRGGRAAWLAVRDEVLKAFVRCDDGRLYHPVVAEKGLEVWISKLMRRRAGARGNNSQGKAVALGFAAVHQDLGEAAACLRALNPQAEILAKEAVAEAMADFDALKVAPGTDGERIASDPVTHCVTHSVETASPNADALRTQEKRREDISPLPPLEGGDREASRFEEGWALYPESGRASADLAKARKAWDAAAGEAGEAALVEIIRKYAASEYARHSGGARVPAFQRWLASGKWRNWLASPAAPPSGWAGPADLREAIIAKQAERRGRVDAEAWARTWIDAATSWSEVPKAIVCRSGAVEKRLSPIIGQLLRERGVQLLLTTSEAA